MVCGTYSFTSMICTSVDIFFCIFFGGDRVCLPTSLLMSPINDFLGMSGFEPRVLP